MLSRSMPVKFIKPIG